MQTIAANRLPRALLAAVLLLALLGCPAGQPAGTILSVTVTGGNLSLIVGESQALTAVVTASGTIGDSVTWSSEQPAIASIDQTGRLTALTEGSTTITATSDADPTKNDSITATIAQPGIVLWTRLFGTGNNDHGWDATTDAAGNIIVTGFTAGGLDGTTAGLRDIFVRKYDPDGNHLWTRQLGTSGNDEGSGVATDAAGNIFISGETNGAIEGTSAGIVDSFVRKYSQDGDHLWTRQFGTSNNDAGAGVATDADGNVIIGGSTLGDLAGANAGFYDAFVRKYGPDGDLAWTRQFGTSSDDLVQGVATDAAGNVVIAGYTRGGLEGASAGDADIFVRKYDPDGNHLWTRQFGTSRGDFGEAIATDGAGNILMAGSTTGDVAGANAGLYDAFVRKYGPDGNLAWTRQFGTSSDDSGQGAATDAAGNVIIAGYTAGGLTGDNAGLRDVYVRKYSSEGDLIWSRQFGTSGEDQGLGAATDTAGNIIVTGSTNDDLGGDNAGSTDVFVRKYGR